MKYRNHLNSLMFKSYVVFEKLYTINHEKNAKSYNVLALVIIYSVFVSYVNCKLPRNFE